MNKQKVLNVVRTVAVADAFAMPLMTRPPYLIREDYGSGKLVEDMLALLPDSPGYPLPMGSVTDVFASSYCLLRSILRSGGVTPSAAEQALFDWREGEDTKVYYDKFAGKTTRLRMEYLDGTHIFNRFDKVPCEGRFITNGGASRAWVAGLLNPGNVDRAIDDALTLTMPTHPNAIAGSGAAAVAAMVSAALGGVKAPDKLFDVAREAVQAGYRKMEMATNLTAVGAKLPGRMELAANLAVKYGNDEEKLAVEMHDCVGVGAYTSEVVPSDVGFILAAGNDLEKALRLAVNAGNQTNKTASIVCAVVAASSGSTVLADKYYDVVKKNNTLDLDSLEKELSGLF